jgi:hypothetical protein
LQALANFAVKLGGQGRSRGSLNTDGDTRTKRRQI